MFSAPNYTQTPNEFFDVLLPTLKEGELRILLVIMRQTFGWQKKWDKISASQFEKKTGMDDRSVYRSLKSLVEKRLIIKHKKGERGSEECWYSLNVENSQKSEDPIEDSNNFYPCLKDTPPLT